MLLKNMIVTTLLIVLTSMPAFSYQDPASITKDTDPRTSLLINAENFDCFKDLHCLIKADPFKSSNLRNINPHNSAYNRYVVTGTSRNEDIHAIYDAVTGRLIESTVTQRNIALPKVITTTLVSDEYADWEMIGNELVVQNFDKQKMQYKVVLQRGEEIRIEYFDRFGNATGRLS